MDEEHGDRTYDRDLAERVQQLLRSDGPPNDLSPSQFLERVVSVLNSSPEPDEELIRWVGCGELENLIRDHGDELWPRIEELARSDARFRRALRSVWAYDSVGFDRRESLLEELGEFRTTWIRFVVQPVDMSENAPLSWRGVELEGSVSKRELAPLLRSIAAWCERESELTDN